MRKHREKDLYAYKAEIVGGKEVFTVAFMDGEGNSHDVSVNREVFTSLKQFHLAENRLAYKDEVYISHFIEDADDEGLCSMVFEPLPSVENTVISGELCEAIAGLIMNLTDKQRRRFLLCKVDGLTYKQIARYEKCSLLSAYTSVQDATKRIDEVLKNFSGEG